MRIDISKGELRKFTIKNAQSIIVVPNEPLPRYLIFAGENLFAYPNNSSKSILLNITYRNKTTELLSLILDKHELPVIRGTTTLVFTDSDPISYDHILSGIVHSDYPLTFTLVENGMDLMINGDTISGNVDFNQGSIVINATDRFNGSTIFSLPYVRVDSYIPSQYMVFFVFMVAVLFYALITAFFMSQPNHKINLTTMETGKRTKFSTTEEEQDSGYELQNSQEDILDSTAALKSPIPSSIGRDVLNREEEEDEDRSEPIHLDSIKIAPLTKHETYLNIELDHPDMTAVLVNGDPLPSWMTLQEHNGLLMLFPTMDDLGTFIIIVRKNGLAMRILQVVVAYNTDERASGISGLSLTGMM